MFGVLLMADALLLERFEKEVWSKMPHIQDGKIVNQTPLVDLTADLIECAKSVFKIDLDDIQVFGKFDSVLPSGSIKARAALHIAHEAIKTGKLGYNQSVIEATSGNFGIALGQLSKLGLTVIALVSRRLQEGVFDELRGQNIRVVDLDMDICPAPGMENKIDELAAKARTANIRSQMTSMGFDGAIFDEHLSDIQKLLSKQDIINLAIYLAKIYNLFCPAQYQNELNIEVHKTVTAVEIDEQLAQKNQSLKDYELICAFGTGGTSGGLAEFVSKKYDRKSVHVVFPPPGQDVAGIRTKANAQGLNLYDPSKYTEHEIDYEKAKFVLKFFVERGHDIGESTALALYAAMEMAKQGVAKKFIVIVADGIDKYKKNFEQISQDKMPMRIELEDAAKVADQYDKIVWVHTQYTPKDTGIEIIAKSLGVEKSKITIPKASSVNQLLSTQNIPDDIVIEKDKKTLLVCMAGNTSLMAAQVLSNKGMAVQSLNGGITNLPEGRTKHPSEYIELARQ